LQAKACGKGAYVKVFIVTETDYEYWQIKRVFSSREKAERYLDRGKGIDPKNYFYPILEKEVE